MPSSLVTALAAPLREVAAMVGTGPVSTAAPTTLAAVRDAAADISSSASRAWQHTTWIGAGGDAAGEFTRTTVAALGTLADRAGRLSSAASQASDAVMGARARLRAIVEAFEARASALEARIDEPGVARQLAAEARRALDDANAVLDELRAELDGHRDVVSEPAVMAAQTAPAGGMGSWGGLGSGLGSSGGSGSGMSSGLGSMASNGLSGASGSGGGGVGADSPSARTDGPAHLTDPETFGSGVAVHLPDGSTATAPNAVAASAVRHALTQLGVPYSWGGTSPGRGLDCSGLTQWAYHEAGLDLPRLAQEQDVGSAVGRGALRPGDLAVWDGHVAMVVGNGLMVEAGDPVKLSTIRTTNAGQGFQGFWRPTA